MKTLQLTCSGKRGETTTKVLTLTAAVLAVLLLLAIAIRFPPAEGGGPDDPIVYLAL